MLGQPIQAEEEFGVSPVSTEHLAASEIRITRIPTAVGSLLSWRRMQAGMLHLSQVPEKPLITLVEQSPFKQQSPGSESDS